MRLTPLLAPLLAASAALAPLHAQPRRLTLEETVLGRGAFVHFFGGFPDLAFAEDGAGLRPADRDPVTVQKAEELKAALEALPGGGAGAMEAELSPDGRSLAFVRDHDLFVVDIAAGVETRLTQGGSEELLHGRLDWVYQEEVYERGNFKAFWWSPDSAALVFYQIDEAPVKEFTLVDHVPEAGLDVERAVTLEVANYPKAGDPNPVVKLGIARRAGGEVVWVDLAEYDSDILIVRAGWTPDSAKVVFEVQDRIQSWLDLNYADPPTGAVTRVLRETSDSWVNILGLPQWLEDGSFLWLSERTGYKHIYHYAPDGELRRPVTRGEWAVDETLRVDEAGGQVWFTATKDGAINRNAYRVGLDGGEVVRVTRDDGTHEVVISPDGSRFVDVFSSLSAPPELRMCLADGTVARLLQRAPVPTLQSHVFVKRRLLKVPARDGYVMDATLLEPPDFDSKACYPVFLDVYGGPDTPTVTNEWNAGAEPFHQFLAQQGILVFQVNNRSASGGGQVYTAACYENFGASELRDYEDAVAWLCAHSWADGSRVAISGWSYGGTMAAYALTHSDRFVLGIAGAGVYDWRLYDSIYTERYMNLPQANPEGYHSSSCIEAAENLHGHLLILHGTMDDNVHVQNAMQLVYALQQAGKSDFEIMLYPRSRHGVVDDEQRFHMRRMVWSAIEKYLLE